MKSDMFAFGGVEGTACRRSQFAAGDPAAACRRSQFALSFATLTLILRNSTSVSAILIYVTFR